MKIKQILFGMVLFTSPAMLAGGYDLQAQDQSCQFTFSQNLGNDECFKVLFDDFNRDGLKDILVINFKSSSKIWINRGDGSFANSGTSFGSGYNHGGALGDIDGDGDNDLVIVSTMAIDKVYLNDGAGSFTVHQSLGGQMDFTTQCLLGDLDGDGDADLLTAHTFKPNKIWLNDGNGTFTLKETFGSDGSYYMDLADVDLDGDLDLYLEEGELKDKILLNDGQGNFSDAGWNFGIAEGGGHGIFHDFNGDQYPDLFLPNDIHGSQVYINNGGDGFDAAGNSFGEGNTAGLLDADLDGDYDVILSKMDGATKLYLNDGNCGFRSYGQQFADEKCWSVICEDLDGDGDADLILGNSEISGSDTKLYFNDASGSSSISNHFKHSGTKIFPNPASDVICVEAELNWPGQYNMVMTNVEGRKDFMCSKYCEQTGFIRWFYHTGQLPAGIYFCSLYFGEERVMTEKLVLN